MSIPDLTQRFPDGMYDVYEEPTRLDLTFGDALNDYMEMAKSDDYFYCLIYVVINGKRYEFRKLEDVKRKYAHLLNENLYHTYWHDETIFFEL